jgi:hypothetical protein
VDNDALRPADAERGRRARSFSSRALTLVVDASVAIAACLAATGSSSCATVISSRPLSFGRRHDPSFTSLDARLRRADRLGLVVSVSELG